MQNLPHLERLIAKGNQMYGKVVPASDKRAGDVRSFARMKDKKAGGFL